jgi:hypothetical protein
MSSSSLKLKNARNWFAAGTEVQHALSVLSDGSFKLFMHICLNAERATGFLSTTQMELARTLHKSPGAIRKYLAEMETAGICKNSFSNNPVTRGSVQITPVHWPYESEAAESTNDAGAEKYIANIRTMISSCACARIAFSTADEILARKWFNDGVALERIEQSILLGSARKYVAWRNNQAIHSPIVTLRYFDPIIEEIGMQKFAPDYWEFLRIKIQRQEKLWIQKHQEEKDPEIKTDQNPSK